MLMHFCVITSGDTFTLINAQHVPNVNEAQLLCLSIRKYLFRTKEINRKLGHYYNVKILVASLILVLILFT